MEELKSAGFSIPSGCPDSVMLRDVRIEKSLIRTGTSATRYCFAVHYKPFKKSVNEYFFSNMFVLAGGSEKTENTDYNKAQKWREYDWVTKPITAASVKQVKESKDLYVN